MNLVVGATGLLGGEICRRLAERGQAVRALVRSTSEPTRVEQLRGLGAEIVVGDLRDRASLDAACRGIRALATTATAILRPDSLEEVDARGQINLVEIARAAGVEHIVYTSISSALDSDFPLLRAKRTVEVRLSESGLSYTILRPTMFMDAWLSPLVGFDAANARARIYGDGLNPISWIALGEMAEFAVQSLATPEMRNRTLDLGGPDALSPLEAVHIYENLGGQKFDLQYVSVESLQKQLADAADPKQQSFTGLMLGYARGDIIDMTEILRQLPVQLTSLQEHARQTLGIAAVALKS